MWTVRKKITVEGTEAYPGSRLPDHFLDRRKLDRLQNTGHIEHDEWPETSVPPRPPQTGEARKQWLADQKKQVKQQKIVSRQEWVDEQDRIRLRRRLHRSDLSVLEDPPTLEEIDELDIDELRALGEQLGEHDDEVTFEQRVDYFQGQVRRATMRVLRRFAAVPEDATAQPTEDLLALAKQEATDEQYGILHELIESMLPDDIVLEDVLGEPMPEPSDEDESVESPESVDSPESEDSGDESAAAEPVEEQQAEEDGDGEDEAAEEDLADSGDDVSDDDGHDETPGSEDVDEGTTLSFPVEGENGWWKLSNGKKVRGEDKAQRQQRLLDSE